MSHLHFDVEIGSVAQTLDDEVGTMRCGNIDSEARSGGDLDARKRTEAVTQQTQTLFDAKQPAGLCRIVHGDDDHRAKQLSCLSNDVDMAKVYRIETPWVQGATSRTIKFC